MIYIPPSLDEQRQALILWDNVLTRGTLFSSASLAAGPKENALGPQTYDYWMPSTMPANLRTQSLPVAETSNCAAIFAHNLGSTGCSVRIEYSVDGSTGWTQAMPYQAVPDDGPILLMFPAQAGKGWLLRISGGTAPSVGLVMIGKALRVPGGVLSGYVPLSAAKTVDLMSSVTLGGHFVGTRAIRQGAGTQIPLAEQPREWVEGDAAPFIDHYNRGGTFAWASCPELLRDDVGYCWRSGDTLRGQVDPGLRYVQGMTMQVLSYA